MLSRNIIVLSALSACLAGTMPLMAQAQEPAYGMMFQPKPTAAPSQEPPALVLDSRPLTQADVDNAVINSKKPNPTIRTPTPSDLARMPLSNVPSAEPASFEQQQAARMAAWQAQEEQRIEHERQVRLAQEAEARKTQVVVVQQQQDPFLSRILAIPRAIGYLFGGGTVR